MSVIYGQPITLGGGKPVLLWENASLDSEFVPQTVTIGAYSNYDSLIIEFSNPSTCNPRGTAGRVLVNSTSDSAYGFVDLGASYNVPRRRFTVSNGLIEFGVGKISDSSEFNYRAIPTRIWGVKFTL